MALILQTIKGLNQQFSPQYHFVLLSTLALFVLRLTANYANYVITLDHFAVTADLLNGSSYFHNLTPQTILTAVAFKICLFKHRIILMRHQMGLYLCHKVHNNNNDNQQ
jgi:hypothetical protein